MKNERILDVFPAADDLHRLVIALERSAASSDRLVVRQESFSTDVGWFVQSRVSIEPEQLAGLKAALTGSASPKLRSRGRDLHPVAATIPFEAAAS